MKKITFSLLVGIFAYTSLLAQQGPGGVGNASNNQMWLSGDFGTFTDNGTTPAITDGNRVQQWNDRSGNGRNATSNTFGNRPIFEDNAANGKPGLRFTGNLFIDGPSPGIPANSGYTYLIAFRDTLSAPGRTNDGSGQFILDRTPETNGLVSLKPVNNAGTGNRYFYQKRNNSAGGLGGVSTTTTVNTSTKLIQMRRDYNTNYQIFYNNQNQSTLNDNDGLTTPPVPRLGRHAATNNGGLRGYINEFIVYNFAINQAQTTIVNNYLSAKYGLVLNANDLYTMDDPAFGDFDNEVAGIGRINASNLHNDAQGSGIIRVLNPTNLDNNEYLFWGHDGGNLSFTNFADSPASGDFVRLDRVWRVSEVNTSNSSIDVGGIDLRISVSELGTIPVSALNLMLDTDNDGSFADETPISGASDLGGGIYEFSNVTAIADQMRFTLATSRYILNTDGDWETASNWNFNSVPSASNSVIISADGVLNNNLGVANITIEGTSSLTISGTNQFSITGDLNNAGTITGEGEVVLNATSAQTISGGGDFENLRLDNPTSVSIDNPLDTPINLNGVLYVDQGTLNTDDNLYLRCAFGIPPKTAQIGPVASGSNINGDVTVEQCYPARRAFRFISSSVTTSTTIRQNWQEDAQDYNSQLNTDGDPIPNGYGTHITGNNTSETDNSFNDGLDYNPSGNPSMYTFKNNNPDRGWVEVTDTDVSLTAGDPYRLFIRGDRSIDVTLNSSTPTDTRLRATGALLTGTTTQSSLTSVAGFASFIGNPYQAQVDINALIAGSTNVSAAEYYVWDPTRGVRGAYATVDLSTTPATNSVGSSANEFLQPMQAAFVLTLANGPASVTFEESFKDVSPAQTSVKSSTTNEFINIQLFNSESFAEGNTPSDGLRINFDKSYSITTKDDAPKLVNLDENLARVEGNAYSAIERRPFPEEEERLELFINQYRREAYVMKFDLTDNLNTKVFIEDKYLNQTQEITTKNNTYAFTVNTSVPESEASDRFSLVFEPISLSTPEENISNLSLYPNPTQGNFRISGRDLEQGAELEIYNMIGQQVYKKSLRGQSSIEVTDFNANTGLYLVKLKTNQGERTFKLIKE